MKPPRYIIDNLKLGLITLSAGAVVLALWRLFHL
jgi:hypothetical protein